MLRHRAALLLSFLALWPGPLPCWHRHAEVAERILTWHSHIHHAAETPRHTAWHFHLLLPWELSELQEGNELDSPLTPGPEFGCGLMVSTPPPDGCHLQFGSAVADTGPVMIANPPFLSAGAAAGIRRAGASDAANHAAVTARLLCAVALC